MHRADRWTPQIGILAPQPLPNFRRAPRRILPLQPNDLRFDDCGQLLGLPVRAAAAVRKGFSTVVSKAFEDLVTGLARDPELPAEAGHLLAIQQPGHKSHAFMHHVPLLPRHWRPPLKGQSVTYVTGMECYLVVRLFIRAH